MLLLALAVRLLGITTTEVWADEGTTLMFMRAPWSDLLTHMHLAKDHPPLVYLLFKTWSLLSSAEWSLRLLPVLMGVGAVAALMRAARLIDPRSAIPTGLLAAFSPVPVYYSQELRQYSLLFLLTALCLWAAVAAQQRASRWRVAWLAVVGALAAHTQSVGLFIFPMCAVFLLVLAGWTGVKALLRPSGVWLWLLLVSPMIWFNVQLAGAHAGDWWIPQITPRIMRGFAEEYFGLYIVELWQRTHVPRPWWTGFILERLLMLGAVVLALAAMLDQRRWRPLAATVAATGVYIGLMIAISYLTVPSIIIRTLLPAWAPVLLLLGLGGAVGASRLQRVAPCLAVGLLSCLYVAENAWSAYVGPPRRPPSRATYRWVRDQVKPHDLVVSAWGLQDLSVYYLGDVLPAEQFWGTTAPLFTGSPPVRKMLPLVEDPHWRDQLRAAATAAYETSGGEYSIWYIEFGANSGPTPGSIPEVLWERHRGVEVFMVPDAWTEVATRFVPVQATTRSVP